MTTATPATRSPLAAASDAPARTLATVSALVLLAAFLSVFYHVTVVVGGTAWLVAYVGAALALATALSRTLSARRGLLAGGALLAAGMAGYLLLLPPAYYRLFSPSAVVGDVRAWLTGRSVLLVLQVDLWAVAVAPAPAFLTWYLALRRRYAAAAVAGGLALMFFVLTGDADSATTVAGAVGVLGLLGFGTLDLTEGTGRQARGLGLLLAVAVLAARSVGLVPGTAAASAGDAGRGTGGGAGRTLEASLLSESRLFVRGSVSLSPRRRFHVTADRPAYWHAAAFERYTGRGWLRRERTSPWSGPLPTPPGPGETVQQRFEVQSSVRAMPAAWKPVLLGPDATSYALVGPDGDVSPARPLVAGESYTVVSQIPTWTRTSLREAGTDYPAEVRERHLQVPDSTPKRVARRAGKIAAAAGADTPFDVARAVQGWLVENKEYSLDVRRRGWDAADAFLFRMDRGYCVHFSTAMAVMLRTQGVPARVAVGYAPGEQTGEHTWVVRGFDSHAWVEVYFPGTGWVPFDPTPAAPRRGARERRLEAGAANETAAPGETTATPEAGATATAPAGTPTVRPGGGNLTDGLPGPILDDPNENATVTPASGTPATETVPGAVRGGGNASDAGDADFETVADRVGGRDRLSLLATVAGVVLGARHFGLLERAVAELRLRWQPATDSPGRDIERAFDRLEYYLGRRHRPRGSAETPRQYVAALEGLSARGRARRVAELYERCRYAGEATREAADEAIRLVDDVVGGS